MKGLPYLARLATRRASARRESARLHAEIVEARLTARAAERARAARVRARLRGRLGGLRIPRRPRPAVYCARAGAHLPRTITPMGGTR